MEHNGRKDFFFKNGEKTSARKDKKNGKITSLTTRNMEYSNRMRKKVNYLFLKKVERKKTEKLKNYSSTQIREKYKKNED